MNTQMTLSKEQIAASIVKIGSSRESFDTTEPGFGIDLYARFLASGKEFCATYQAQEPVYLSAEWNARQQDGYTTGGFAWEVNAVDFPVDECAQAFGLNTSSEDFDDECRADFIEKLSQVLGDVFAEEISEAEIAADQAGKEAAEDESEE